MDSGLFSPVGLWLYEFALLTLFSVFGVFYCLEKCRVDARRNFLIDFLCLSTPVTVTTLAAVWGTFHLFATFLPWWLQLEHLDSRPNWVNLFYSNRFFDLMRFFATVFATFLIFLRVGNHIERVSTLRESANDAVQETFASGASP